MKNRILTLIIAIIMLIPSGAGAALKGTECEKEAGLLAAIGVIDENAINSMDETRMVTRKEFAEYLVKAAGIIPISEQTRFSDYTAEGAVSNAVVSGIISGHDDGSFKPGNTILVAEAVKMTVEAMKLDILMTSKDYPVAYMNVASERKLMKNVNGYADAGMTVSDTVHLLYNMLNASIPSAGNNLSEIVFDDSVTLLSERFDIKKASGVVTGNEHTRLTLKEGVTEGYVEINNTVYSTGSTNAGDYLGYKVDYYYNSGDEEIVYITYADRVSDIVLYSDEIESFENSVYYYLNSEASTRATKAVLEDDVNIIYNGKAKIGITDTSVYTPDYGYVVMTDNNNNSKYDTLFIYDITVISYSMYNETDAKLFGKYTFDKAVTFDVKESSVMIKDSFGKSLALSDLKEGDILEIAQSEDELLTDITVYRNAVTVRVSGSGTDDEGRNYVTDGEKRYIIEDSLVDYMSKKQLRFASGKEYIFYTDARGRIAGYDKLADKDTGGYGYLLTVKPDEVDDEIFYAKILTAEGEIVTYTPAKKVRVDGENVKPEPAYIYLDGIVNNGTTSVVIWYETNADGLLSLVDTPQRGLKEGSDTLHVKGKSNNENYNNGAKTVGGKVTFNNSSIVFTVPAVSTVINEKDYSVQKPQDTFVHYNPYTVTGYSRNRKSPFSDVVLHVGQVSENIVSKADVLLVQNVSECLDPEEEMTYEITVLTAEGEKKYVTEDLDVVKNAKPHSGSDKLTVKRGDVIRVSLNQHNRISAIQVIYSPESGDLYLDKNPTNSNIPYPFTDTANISKYYQLKSDFGNVCRLTFGNVFYKSDGYLRVVNPIFDLSQSSIVKSIEDGEITLENYEAVNIFKYEPRNRVPYRKADISEIYDYDTTKMASEVLIRTNDGRTKIIVIY